MKTPSTMQWIRQAAQRISLGSTRLTAHLGARAAHRGRGVWRRASGWLSAGHGVGWALRLAVLLGVAALLRKIVTAVGGGVYAAVADGRAPWLLWGAAIGWVIGAYRVGHPAWKPKTPAPDAEPATDEQPDDAPHEDPEDVSARPPLPTFHHLCEALDRVGTPHAHIAALAEDLGTTTEQVRVALDRCGVAVEPVRMRGRGSSTGIKGGSLPTPRPAPEGVVGAGQPANNDNNNADEDRPREGVHVRRTDGGLIIYDLADTVRHQKVPGAK
ncbi:hypothetical protein [Streptomyces longwoodensis]|uniref:hypothetical protein n=1 Tax=Streptomyces longwoodensis TaxID=68231 RepID=UPI0036EE2EE1